MLPAYAELHCLSGFSFLRGASHPEELIAQAGRLGYAALALTDECSVAGVVRAHLAARENGLPFIVGSEFRLVDHSRILLLAPDRQAYGDLCELISCGRRRGSKGAYSLQREDVARYGGRCLALWLHGADHPQWLANRQPDWFAEVFRERAWLAATVYRDGFDEPRHRLVQAWQRRLDLPITACGDVRMHVRSRRYLQDVLTAVRMGTTVQAAGQSLNANSERVLRTRTELARLYPPEWLAQSVRIASRCSFSLNELRYEYPGELVPAGETAASHLRALVAQGVQQRWPRGATEKVQQLIAHELELISELHYEPYFLTVHDMVAFARSRGILCQGRGSAANSAVCFALGITEVDPARMEMLFERFISKERDEPPDIDVDFEHERREEVMQYIYRKYGRERAALAATVITYRPKSAIRDVGKALGLGLDQVDRLAKGIKWWDGRQIDVQRVREAGLDPESRIVRMTLKLAQALLGFPRHLSQHVGGFVIARDRLTRLVPVENAAMAERTVIQWDKDDLDALGLLKVDCLSLGMLTAIRKAFDLIERFDGRRLSMAALPADDVATYRMIQRADTVGVFQIESRAQMAMLPRLRPGCFYDLVIEVAIVRPGPIQGDMVHPYLRRRQGLEPVSYPSEAVRDALQRTLGVPIFQEQVIKLAMVAAGFSPGEADGLRRSMAAWRRRGGLEQFEQRLTAGMRARGYSDQFAQQIFQQIQGFGEYGFPESHAASFALLAYASAWLKCHEPAAFVCALLNSQPMGFYAPAQLVQDARRHGVEVRPVDVCASERQSTLETGDNGKACVRLGLDRIRSLSAAAIDRLLEARRMERFVSVEQLAQTAQLKRGDLTALAAAGALQSLAGHRHRAYWAAAAQEPFAPLLQQASVPEAIPLLKKPTEGEDLVADYASLGLSLERHPLCLLRLQLQAKGVVTAAQLRDCRHGQWVKVAGLVINRQRPGTATGVIFATLEDETGHVNLVVWSHIAERQRRELLAARLLRVAGRVQREGEVIHIVARRLWDDTALLGRLLTRSRDFQ